MSDPNDYGYVGWAELLRRLRSLLEGTGLTCSKYIIDHSGNTPSHLVNDTFSLDIQTLNTGEYRDVTPMQAQHTIGIVVVWKVAPANDQFTALTTELDREETLLRSVLSQADTAEVRVVYQDTNRTLSPDRAYLVVRHTLTATHDWYGEPQS